MVKLSPISKKQKKNEETQKLNVADGQQMVWTVATKILAH